MKTKYKTLIVIAGLVVLAGTFAGVARYVSAQAPNSGAESNIPAHRGGGEVLERVAEILGIPVEELESAFQTVHQEMQAERLAPVAEELGVTVEELQHALQEARPAECENLQRGEKPEGVDCRPNLETAAETLGVDVEELRTALQNEFGGRRGPGHGGPHGDGGRP